MRLLIVLALYFQIVYSYTLAKPAEIVLALFMYAYADQSTVEQLFGNALGDFLTNNDKSQVSSQIEFVKRYGAYLVRSNKLLEFNAYMSTLNTNDAIQVYDKLNGVDGRNFYKSQTELYATQYPRDDTETKHQNNILFKSLIKGSSELQDKIINNQKEGLSLDHFNEIHKRLINVRGSEWYSTLIEAYNHRTTRYFVRPELSDDGNSIRYIADPLNIDLNNPPPNSNRGLLKYIINYMGDTFDVEKFIDNTNEFRYGVTGTPSSEVPEVKAQNPELNDISGSRLKKLEVLTPDSLTHIYIISSSAKVINNIRNKCE